jgi:hypothetical protein
VVVFAHIHRGRSEYRGQIASSFSEFLDEALRSEGYEFWLG